MRKSRKKRDLNKEMLNIIQRLKEYKCKRRTQQLEDLMTELYDTMKILCIKIVNKHKPLIGDSNNELRDEIAHQCASDWTTKLYRHKLGLTFKGSDKVPKLYEIKGWHHYLRFKLRNYYPWHKTNYIGVDVNLIDSVIVDDLEETLESPFLRQDKLLEREQQLSQFIIKMQKSIEERLPLNDANQYTDCITILLLSSMFSTDFRLNKIRPLQLGSAISSMKFNFEKKTYRVMGVYS